jgi:hypothetical protein
MNKQQESRTNMFNAVLQVLDEHHAIFDTVPALSTAASDLRANLLAISACVEKQVVDLRGFARDKLGAEQAMMQAAVVVAKGTLAYATVTGNMVLAGKMSVTRRLLERHADGVVARHCQVVLAEATAVGAALADYGVDAARLEALEQAIRRYEAALAAPRLAITARKGATTELVLVIRDTQRLLATRLDALMERFATEDPALHRAYWNARIIVDRGRRAKEAPEQKAA